ncbi:hypothetical protein [Caldicellulosiruptor naganoensis]|uniref:hypothetical protein n=1 Tax=Caldicellulosiruptor naganoensis TaxID=29324 RepID=UPI001F41D218|nr:hypothetical protein [Caldicellulosiruptor naganoensis]
MLIDAFEDRVKQKITEITNYSVLQVLQHQRVEYDDIVKFEKKTKVHPLSRLTPFIQIRLYQAGFC